MKSKAFRKTHGRHGFQGKGAGRGARLISKICKGLAPVSQETWDKIRKDGDRDDDRHVSSQGNDSNS